MNASEQNEFEEDVSTPTRIEQPALLSEPGQEQPALGDRCPGVAVLHRAEDGWLARIRLPGGRLSARQIATVADLSDMGNGLVELTARANLQVRGLGEFAGIHVGDLAKLVDLMPSATHDRVRNILASPLAGRDGCSLVSTDELVGELDRAICDDPRLAELSGRFLFGIDDGAAYVAGQNVDIGLVAERADDGADVCFRLVLGDLATDRRVTSDRAVALVLDACHEFLAMATKNRRIWRIRDLEGGIASLADALGTRVLGVRGQSRDRRSHPRDLPLGVSEQLDGRLAVTTLAPLGRIPTEALVGLPHLLRHYDLDARISPWRTLTLLDVERTEVPAVTDDLRRLGLLVEASGWHRLSACAGLGACANAIIDVRTVVAQRARTRSPNSATEHWSACEKQCGRLASVELSAHATGDRIVIEEWTRRREVPSVPEALALLEDVISP